ncbi:MAG TPA: hypothetical protein VNO30_06445 [Kofleriaceae bacterium]|nr:hypothetical protein [Kofleriaceae bacterium]
MAEILWYYAGLKLRVPPDEVRELYHSWLVGLWAGELQRPEPALPMRRTEQDVVRRVTCEQLASMLAALPEKQPTRISLARALGEYFISDDKEEFSTSFAEYRNLAELGGFVVSGPTTISEITRRVGAGEYRVSAYGLDVPGMRWEVFVTLDEEDEEPSDPVSAKTP